MARSIRRLFGTSAYIVKVARPLSVFFENPPHRPRKKKMPAASSDITEAFTAETKFPDDAMKSMKQEGIFNYENIAPMAADEKELKEGFVEVLQAQGCTSMETLSGQLGAKKM